MALLKIYFKFICYIEMFSISFIMYVNTYIPKNNIFKYMLQHFPFVKIYFKLFMTCYIKETVFTFVIYLEIPIYKIIYISYYCRMGAQISTPKLIRAGRATSYYFKIYYFKEKSFIDIFKIYLCMRGILFF